MAKVLTKHTIESLNEPGRYKDGLATGLYLQVGPNGNKSWILRYKRDGRERQFGLGPLSVVSLVEARKRASRAQIQLLDGIDPIEQRQAQRAERRAAIAKQMTFEAAALGWLKKQEVEWKNGKSRSEFVNSFKRHVYPKIGRVPVADIDTPQVLSVIEPLWANRNVLASRLLRQIAAVLDWARVGGYRTADNCARWKGYLDQLLPKPAKIHRTKHHPALDYRDLNSFVIELRQRESVAARALEIIILSAARMSEAVNAKWAEIDLDEATWTVPAVRMKGDREHRIALSERAVEILRELPREGDYVFVGANKNAPMTSMAISNLIKRMGDWTDKDGRRVTCHGFRSTFSTWANERTSHSHAIIEAALAHRTGNAVSQAYNRGDLLRKRRKLMDDFAVYANTKPATGENVVAIRDRQTG